MIKSFKCKEAEKIFQEIFSAKFPHSIQVIAFRKLELINAASNLNDLRVPPGNKLEKLSGHLNGLYSIRINKQWRICFIWKNNHAYNLEITDYH